MYVRGLVLAADGLAGVDGFVRGKRSLCQVQLLVPLIADGQLPGLEQDAWLPVGQHLVGGDNSCTPGIPGIKVGSHKLELLVVAIQRNSSLKNKNSVVTDGIYKAFQT